MKLPIYLDYASTTPIDNRVVKKMINFFNSKSIFGNASSKFHKFGWEAAEYVDISRNLVAELIGAKSLNIIFTSGATESNNLAIKGIVEYFSNKNIHIITSNIEHKSVLNTCAYLNKKYKLSITYINPENNGIIDVQKIKKSIKKNTILISIMHVNNEIGVIQDIKSIGMICKEKNIFYHVDGTQSIGKIPLDIKKINIDLLSFSGHKMYGPKGIGVLYLKNRIKKILQPQIHGGNHEFGLRSGTLPVHQIIAIGEACKIAKKEMFNESKKIKILNKIFLNEINNIEQIKINGDKKLVLPNIINLSFKIKNINNFFLKFKDIAVSNGATCNNQYNNIPSHVLSAIGINKIMAMNSIRISIGKFTTKKEIIFTIKLIKKIIKKHLK